MKKLNWQVLLGVALILCSALFYYIHYIIFGDAHHIWIYLVGDIAFVPIEVLLVTLILHKLLSYREKKNLLEKMNMVIGAFFSEVGLFLLKRLSKLDSNSEEIVSHLKITRDWTDAEFRKVARLIKNCSYIFSLRSGSSSELAELKEFLEEKRAFLLRLLQNPNLLEHDSFTDLLWAVFHLTEELSHRTDLASLPQPDYKHVAGDIERAYSRMIAEWLDYMEHLKSSYPYLFSLAIRTNPFDPDAVPEISG